MNEADPAFRSSHFFFINIIHSNTVSDLVTSILCLQRWLRQHSDEQTQSNMEQAPDRAKAAIWKHFKLDTPTSPTAICNICNANVARGGDKVGKFNTTNLNKHLQKHHAKEHAELRAKPAESTTKQLTLVDALQRREKLPAGSVKATNITEKIMEFIVLDSQPLSVVDNEGFRRLLEHLEPRYSLPS